MNSNGRNRNNTFAGDVLIDGDLVVTGTINGGGGGGGDVTNPMTSDLNANNYQINNVSEITAGEEGFIRTGSLDFQENNILNVDTLDIKKLTTSNPALFIDCDNKGLVNLSAIQLSNGLYFSASYPPEENYVLTVGAGATHIEYKKAVFNPAEEAINMNNNNITNINNIETTGINSSTGATAFTSTLNMFNDINMDSNDIFNVDRLTTTHAGVSINLDLVPATEGKAGQVLARDPAFDPLNFATHKLVWANQSAGGGVTNPMTANLQAAQYSIFDAQTLESKNFNVMASGSGLSCANGSFAVPITWGLAQKLSLAPFYQTFNTDYITPATSAGLTLDSKAPDGITDSKITLSAPTININNSTNLAPSNINITGNLQITNSSGYIHGNNLIVRGRNASAVPTPITIEGTTTSINSSTLNITSSTANNIAGTTNFTGTVRTNTIDANSGGTISVLQNLTLATGRQLRTDLLFSDGLRSYTTDLILAGLLPDNKTQTNILLASPQISLNNQFGPLVPETQVNIAGGIVFNNPVSNPFIHGSNLTIRGRTPLSVATPITIEGTTTTINSSTLTIYSTLNNNIGGTTDFTDIATFQEKPNFISGIKSNILDTYTGNNISCLHNLTLSTGKELKTPTATTNTINVLTGTSLNINATDTNISNKLNVLTNRSASIGVRTTLFKTFGALLFVDLNTLTPIKANSTIPNQKGTNLMPAGGFVNGDKFIIIMYGLLTTFGTGSLNIALYVGATAAVTFNITNIASSNQPFKITFEIDCTVSGNNVNLSNGTALLSMERFNSSIRFSTATASNIVDNSLLNNTIDVYMYQSAIQTSYCTPLSYTIEQL